MQTSEAAIKPTPLQGNYRIERFTVDRLNDLAYLYIAVYGRLILKEYLLKKYNTAYTGVMYTGYLAYDNANLPVAFYAVIPCFIKYEDQLVLAAQSADTMTHPAHRNKGLFVELANRTYDLCRAEGIRLVFGFPNQNSVHGFVNKLNWQVFDRLQRFHFPVKSIPLEKLALKFSFLQPFYHLYVRLMIPRRHDQQMANSVTTEGYAGICRNADYIAYKTYNTTHTIKTGTATVWFKIQNGLIIGDITGSLDKPDQLLSRLLTLAKKLGLGSLQFQVSEGTQLYAMLKKRTEPIPSFPVGIKDLGCDIPAEKIKFTFADIDIF